MFLTKNMCVLDIRPHMILLVHALQKQYFCYTLPKRETETEQGEEGGRREGGGQG